MDSSLESQVELTVLDMKIFSVYIINKSGGLIYSLDDLDPANESISSASRTIADSSVALPITLKLLDERVMVYFGEGGAGIEPGVACTELNDKQVWSGRSSDGIDVISLVEQHGKGELEASQYPFKLTFEKPKKTSNEKIVLASMFNTMYAIASQMSPCQVADNRHGGIELLETESIHLHCYQTPTGTKFLVESEPMFNSSSVVQPLMRRIYQLYADFALKDPFYTIEMPIKGAKFEQNIRSAVKDAKYGKLNLVN